MPITRRQSAIMEAQLAAIMAMLEKQKRIRQQDKEEQETIRQPPRSTNSQTTGSAGIGG